MGQTSRIKLVSRCLNSISESCFTVKIAKLDRVNPPPTHTHNSRAHLWWAQNYLPYLFLPHRHIPSSTPCPLYLSPSNPCMARLTATSMVNGGSKGGFSPPEPCMRRWMRERVRSPLIQLVRWNLGSQSEIWLVVRVWSLRFAFSSFMFGVGGCLCSPYLKRSPWGSWSAVVANKMAMT